MFDKIKRWFYFPIASYFAFFARIRLAKWNPKKILITGSSGKTTLLNLIESQLGDSAYYSHHANSAYGIPFNILGLGRQDLTFTEWPLLFLKAPFSLFKKLPLQSVYVIEADCDRTGEGEFIAKLVKPNITLWVSSDRTHSIGFDRSVREGKFAIVEEAIAHEYGFFAEYTKNLVIYNADNHRIEKEVKRTKAAKEPVFEKRSLDRYLVLKDKTEFRIDGKVHSFSDPLPKKTFYALAMTIKLMKFLEKPLDPSFSNFHSAPGRSSRFAGIKNITIIDSCYNANLGSMSTMLEFFESYPGEKKWAVVGDMLEQGEGERIEHEKLAEILSKMKLERIIFLGPRVSK
jgi:UDP-N-acetylmuramoyl-tripeptide--D-alanyl-D-alanine ligase